MNTSGARSGRQREPERRGLGGGGESSWDKITSQDRRLGGSGAGSPAQESALPPPPPPASAWAGRADALVWDGRLGVWREEGGGHRDGAL